MEELCTLSTRREFKIKLGVACMICSAGRERRAGEAERRGVDNEKGLVGQGAAV